MSSTTYEVQWLWFMPFPTADLLFPLIKTGTELGWAWIAAAVRFCLSSMSQCLTGEAVNLGRSLPLVCSSQKHGLGNPRVPNFFWGGGIYEIKTIITLRYFALTVQKQWCVNCWDFITNLVSGLNHTSTFFNTMCL